MPSPPPSSRRRELLRAGALGSLVLHALLAALLLFLPGREPPPEPLPSSSIPVIFEGIGADRTAAPDSRADLAAPALPDAPAASPPLSDPPDIPGPPPSVAEALPTLPGGLPLPPLPSMPLPLPALPLDRPPPMADLPPPPVAAPPATPRPLPPPVPQATAELPRPPDPTPMASAELPLPPPPAPTPPQPAQPPRPAPRPAPSPFAGTLDLSRGPPITLAQPSPRRASPSRGSIDLALGANIPPPSAPRAAANAMTSQVRIRGSELGADWRGALAAWVNARKYYPEAARRADEDGPAVVRMVVRRDGQVESVELQTTSGSRWLDIGLQALFRGQRLPPFPPGIPDESIILYFTMNYILIR
ncbi:TonB family protein [Roseomonas sp. BN140053]|uniref:TonB family protein n=1 Tax=Roseomonas sp. BN140053 TaxID=3391898 RepID=UPI0039EB70AA